MAVPRARVCQPLWSPGYSAVPQQTPDGKGGRNKSGLRGGRSPLAAPRQRPTSGSFSKCSNFSQALDRVRHGRGGSPSADVATPPGCGRCT